MSDVRQTLRGALGPGLTWSTAWAALGTLFGFAVPAVFGLPIPVLRSALRSRLMFGMTGFVLGASCAPTPRTSTTSVRCSSTASISPLDELYDHRTIIVERESDCPACLGTWCQPHRHEQRVQRLPEAPKLRRQPDNRIRPQIKATTWLHHNGHTRRAQRPADHRKGVLEAPCLAAVDDGSEKRTVIGSGAAVGRCEWRAEVEEDVRSLQRRPELVEYLAPDDYSDPVFRPE